MTDHETTIRTALESGKALYDRGCTDKIAMYDVALSALKEMQEEREGMQADSRILDWLDTQTDVQMWRNNDGRVSFVRDDLPASLCHGDTFRGAIRAAIGEPADCQRFASTPTGPSAPWTFSSKR